MSNLTVMRQNVKVSWVDLGEGYGGDYDPDDPSDDRLLRFDVFVLKGVANQHGLAYEDYDDKSYWVSPQDSSYCTRVKADTPKSRLVRLAQLIAEEFEKSLPDYKRTLEELSWITSDWSTK